MLSRLCKLSFQDQPRPCSDNWPVLAVVWDLGMVEPSISTTRYLNILYDEVYSIRYMESVGINMVTRQTLQSDWPNDISLAN